MEEKYKHTSITLSKDVESVNFVALKKLEVYETCCLWTHNLVNAKGVFLTS